VQEEEEEEVRDVDMATLQKVTGRDCPSPEHRAAAQQSRFEDGPGRKALRAADLDGETGVVAWDVMASPHRTQQPSSIPIDVRASAVHGHGAYARIDFQTGQFIARYEGRRYTAAQRKRRNWDDSLTYLFDLGDGSVIDGASGGNATRHINHSCEPNSVAYEHQDENCGERWIEIEALRDIPAGAELSLDYQFDAFGNTASDYTCRCGAAQCRGTMVGAAAAVLSG
jgi:hypothetical protein